MSRKMTLRYDIPDLRWHRRRGIGTWKVYTFWWRFIVESVLIKEKLLLHSSTIVDLEASAIPSQLPWKLPVANNCLRWVPLIVSQRQRSIDTRLDVPKCYTRRSNCSTVSEFPFSRGIRLGLSRRDILSGLTDWDVSRKFMSFSDSQFSGFFPTKARLTTFISIKTVHSQLFPSEMLWNC